MHSIDVRARIIAALALISASVLTPPMGPAEFVAVLICVGSVVALLDGPVAAVFRRALIVIPFAGAIAAFAPLALVSQWSWPAVTDAYATGWPIITTILTKAYISALTVMALTATTPMPELLRGMHALKVPDIFLMMIAFLLRYADLFREQVATMRQAIASRAPQLHGRQLILLYGSLGGNLFVRAYERGEQVYDAMLSRGYTGALPANQPLCWRRADTVFLVLSALFAVAVGVYR